jgi:Metal-dependent hydrolases of the beta-lactamase superfamily III
VRSRNAALLVDCGVPLRTIERALMRSGLSPDQLSAILITHEHGDHTMSAGPPGAALRRSADCQSGNTGGNGA